MPSARDTYAALLNDIMGQLELGVMPWRRPWVVQRPTNLYTRKAYSGVNVLALMNSAERNGYRSSSWLTENQARDRGGWILPSEIDNPTFIAMLYTKKFTVMSKTGAPVALRRLTGRSYPVYNLEQTRGLGRLEPAARNLDLWNHGCERIVQAWTGAPPIIFSRSDAFYRPGTDEIAMPDFDQFESSMAYYATLFHEMIHATGHPARLDRFGGDPDQYDRQSIAYAKEELVAELGSAFLCSEAGIGNVGRQDNVAYLNSWLKALRGDRNFLFYASWLAERACDLVLDRVTGGRREADAQSLADVNSTKREPWRPEQKSSPAQTSEPKDARRRAA